MKKWICYFLLAIASVTTGSSVRAANAPSQLYNKSITVSYTNGTESGGMMAVRRVIFVSSKGNIFVRTSRATRGGGDSHDRDPAAGGGAWRFDGHRLVGIVPRPSGAVQLTITFDANFQSCTVSVLHGKASGQPYVTRTPSGRMISERGRISVSGENCSLQDGNAFAQ
jgi:hypothetical protein